MKRKTIVTVLFAITALLLTAEESEGQQPELPALRPAATLPTDSIRTAARAPWTLQECIRYAVENNIEIKRQELSVEDAELARKQSRLDYIPSLSAGASSGTSFGRVLDQTTYEFLENATNTNISASLSLGTEVFAGMRKYHQLKKSDLNLQDMLLQIDKARNDLSLNITAAYLDVLFAEEQTAIAAQRTRTLALQVEQTQALVESGRKTLGDLLQLQSDLADAQFQDIEARNDRTLAYFTLCQLLEINDYDTFRIVIPETVPVSPEGISAGPEELFEKAQELPQVKSAELALDMADRDISIAKSSLWPTLNLSAGYGSSFSDGRLKPDMSNPDTYVHYPFKDQMRDNASYHISLSLSIPIFNSFSARNNVRSYRIARRRAEYDYRIMQKNLDKEIRQAYIDAVGAYEQYGAAARNVATSEESFRMMEEKYTLGAASPVDYSIALYNLVNARSQLAQAKYSYIFKTKILDFYKGVPLGL
ncbi:MAG TPA: TolC family protein [Candidatus Tidjanibacter gallistercoris]|nr:TolC family protein [Candidatus Tidjanibacter gallistercoris]